MVSYRKKKPKSTEKPFDTNKKQQGKPLFSYHLWG
jgi:hypothetical protein